MKILNEKTITERFIEKHDFNPDTADACDAVDAMKDYYGFEIVDTHSRNADLYVYEESTADGYSVYVATTNLNSICVSEEIFHNEYGIASTVADALRDGQTVGIDEYENIYQEAIDELFSEFVDDATKEIIAELKEQGYVEEITDPMSTLGLLDMVYQRLQTTESDEYIYGVPEQTTESTGKDLRIISYYKQIVNDHPAFRKYVRKVLNCQLYLAGDYTIKLTKIPLT